MCTESCLIGFDDYPLAEHDAHVGVGGVSGSGVFGGNGGAGAAPDASAGSAGTTATGGSSATGGVAGAGAVGGIGGAGGSSGVGGGGAGGGGASGGVGGGTSGSGGTGGAGPACPTGPSIHGPALVMVPAPPGSVVTSYCMDATEVTNAQYLEFLLAGVPTGSQPSYCSWNTTYTPSFAWPNANDDEPVKYVDWCDAYAYCAWAGKHLCGKIGGGTNAYGDDADATKSEWFNACSAGNTLTYPYGNVYDDTACYGIDQVKSKPGCEGGYPGLFDLSGNQQEWEDSCNYSFGPSDECRLRGGSYLSTSSGLRCAGANNAKRDYSSNPIGFRCCAVAS